MYNEIMDAVTRRLYEVFGDGCEIYTDAVEQGLKEPCFFVRFLEPSEKPMIGRRYYRQTDMLIQYLPGKPEQLRRELNQVSEALMDGMEYITLANGSLVRGTGRSYRTEDGILNFFVSYNLFILKEQSAEEPMKTMEIEKGMVK